MNSEGKILFISLVGIFKTDVTHTHHWNIKHD